MTGNPTFDTISLKRIDTHTVEFTRKRAGKVVRTGTNVVSKDGKTRTQTSAASTHKVRKSTPWGSTTRSSAEFRSVEGGNKLNTASVRDVNNFCRAAELSS